MHAVGTTLNLDRVYYCGLRDVSSLDSTEMLPTVILPVSALAMTCARALIETTCTDAAPVDKSVPLFIRQAGRCDMHNEVVRCGAEPEVIGCGVCD